MTVDNILDKIEALLFASGRAIPIDTIADLIEEKNKREVKSAIEKLADAYSKRKSPLMIIEQDKAWKLTVREEHLPLVRKIVADTELPKSVLETLAVIAWKSPALQSTVIKVRTNKAYEHIEVLESYGFITKTKHGRSYKLKLAEKFFQYFDVKDGDIKWMFKDSKGVERELEQEQKKHLELEAKKRLEQTKGGFTDKDVETGEVLGPEGPHLGNLTVVDAVSKSTPESVEIVDEIAASESDGSSVSKGESAKSAKSDEDVEEFLEDLDSEIADEDKAKDEVEEIIDDAIVDEEENQEAIEHADEDAENRKDVELKKNGK